MKNEITHPEWVKVRRYKKYDFGAMVVGELRVLAAEECGCKNLKSFRALVWNRARQLGFELHCRQLDDGSYEIYRSA